MLDRTRLPPAPRARRDPQVSVRHGVTLTDDYAWLRAANWREVMRDPAVLDGEIRRYLDAENAYQKAALAHTEPLQQYVGAEAREIGHLEREVEIVTLLEDPLLVVVQQVVDRGPRVVGRQRCHLERPYLATNPQHRGHTGRDVNV